MGRLTLEERRAAGDAKRTLKESEVRTETACAAAFSLQGKSHVQLGEPLQDSHALVSLPEGWILLVVADGVGSEPRSEVGAALAAEAVAGFVKKRWGACLDRESLLNLLRCAYQHAAGALTRQAEAEKRPVSHFSTTLHTVLYAGGMVYYGHAGDGGILAMDLDGRYVPLTKPQKGPDGESVVPLMAGPRYWEFGSTEEPVASVMACTDGVWDKVCGKLLQNEGFEADRALAAFFLSPWAGMEEDGRVCASLDYAQKVFCDGTPNDFYPVLVRAVAQGGDEAEAVRFVREHLLEGNRPLEAIRAIRDDVTVGVVRSTAILPVAQPQDYYLPPDWEGIGKRVYEALYGRKAKEGERDDAEGH